MNLQTLKGFRDFLPEQARKRQYVISVLKKTFESYGFEPLETPALEYEEVLAGKYGEEGQKLMYRFKDAGGRSVAMRYDQTVPLARVVAQYANNIPLPFKRYQIQNVWRAENPQKGRFREFLQCDVDTVGTSSLFADAEIIQVAIRGYEELGFKDAKVSVNDRAVFEGIDPKAISAIDKLKKIGKEGVLEELRIKGISNGGQILDTVTNTEPTKSIKECTNILENVGITNLKFDPTLARGLDYYTGLIFEIEVEGYRGGSVGGGGRYDKLIGIFANKDIPAVGFSFGFDRTLEAMEELDLFPANLQTSKVLITVSENINQSLEVANKLRASGINVEVYPDTEIGIDKQFKYADKKGISFVILFENGQIFLKDMETGEKSETNLEETIKKLS